MKIKDNHIVFTASDEEVPSEKLLKAASNWDKVIGLMQKSRLFQLEDELGNKVQVKVKDLEDYAWSSIKTGDQDKRFLATWLANKTPQDIGDMLLAGNMQAQFDAFLNKAKTSGAMIGNDLETFNQTLESVVKENNYFWLTSVTPVQYKQTLLNFIVKMADSSQEIVNLSSLTGKHDQDPAIQSMIGDLKKDIASYQEKETKRFADEFSKANPMDVLISKLEIKRKHKLSGDDKKYLEAFAKNNYPELFGKSVNQEIVEPINPEKNPAEAALLNQFSEIIEDAWVDSVESFRNNKASLDETDQTLKDALGKMKTIIKSLPDITIWDRSTGRKISTDTLMKDNLSKLNEMSKNLASPKAPTFEEQLVAKGYTKGKRLGAGAQGSVFIVSRDGKDYAVKTMQKDFVIDRRQWWKFNAGEVNASKVQHPNVLGIRDVIHSENGIQAIIMDIMPGGELCNLVEKGNVTPEKAKKYMHDMALGLQALHHKGIIHHDVKLENAMIDANDNCRLIDFGFARNTAKLGPIDEAMGSVDYAAPELFLGLPHGLEVDIFSYGVALYAALTGKFPGRHNWDKTISGDFSLISDPQARDLITKLLQTDPAKRPTIDQVLAHPYFATKQAQGPLAQPRIAA